MNVVIVESPAKARTINKYLGQDYAVLASFGHVRDLLAKDGAVDPEHDFAMVWEVGDKSKNQISEIRKALKGADTLYLATDPDREGEAISWHVLEVLGEKGGLDSVDVKRVVFHEITKRAVLDAMAHPRTINEELVNAYLARRALDYLVGFTLSPVLWRKLPGARSAGRVQSVALRLICEREAEIEAFRPEEYWTVDADFTTPGGEPFSARLTHLDGRKLERMDLGDEAAAAAAVEAVRTRTFSVAAIEAKKVRRSPPPPFTTSTLQQEASRKLRLNTSRTMQLAQRLYEGVSLNGETVGLITYMRTDSVTLSQEAIQASRRLIETDFGGRYLPDKPRIYTTKAKNAQEAHEAIRPTDLFRRPDQVRHALDGDQFRLYELIWKRTVAAEMENAVLDQVAVDLASPDRAATLRANGSVVAFDGFLKLYREDRDEDANGNGDGDRRLPAMREGEQPQLVNVTPDQHFTQPPPRFSEASLVKKLEELGIGRPSTYASILRLLQDREYVRLDKRRFVPDDKGRLVTAFLSSFFPRYVEYDFTAQMEEKLDDISGGRIDWKTVLRDFWENFSKAVDGAKDVTFSQVVDVLDDTLGPHFFPSKEDESEDTARRCPGCANGRLSIKVGRFGAFIGCSNYPDCRYTRELGLGNGDAETAGEAAQNADLPRCLGTDPETGKEISLRKGPYGLYVQLGEEEALPAEQANGDGGKKTRRKKAPKPPRASLPRGMPASDVDLEKALALLALPREVGVNPNSGEMITAGIGRYGPYVRHGATYVSLKGEDDVLTIGLNRALELIETAAEKRPPPSQLGPHPKDGKPVTVGKGRFGPYVKHGSTFASLPKGAAMESVTLEQAVELIDAKRARAANGKNGKSAKNTTTKKTSTKKTTGKKKKTTNKAAIG